MSKRTSMTAEKIAGLPWTYDVAQAGKMADLGRNASYRAAARGEIPTIRLGKVLRVPAALWRRILAGEVKAA